MMHYQKVLQTYISQTKELTIELQALIVGGSNITATYDDEGTLTLAGSLAYTDGDANHERYQSQIQVETVH